MGVGRKIVVVCIQKSLWEYLNLDLQILVQVYFIEFYVEFGFIKVGDFYDDYGIEYISMIFCVLFNG